MNQAAGVGSTIHPILFRYIGRIGVLHTDLPLVKLANVELTEWDRQQLQGGSPGQVKLMTARIKLLDVLLRRNVVPIEEPVSGRVIGHDIDAWLKDAEPAETEDRHKVWIVRVG